MPVPKLKKIKDIDNNQKKPTLIIDEESLSVCAADYRALEGRLKNVEAKLAATRVLLFDARSLLQDIIHRRVLEFRSDDLDRRIRGYLDKVRY